jgi:LDH2 family malate/lactate/ureidoglycolate dehydrogenase
MQIYRQKGAPIPEGWAFDAEGRPTTDVAQALAGLVQPIGGHKGIGVAMAIGILSTLLSGAGCGRESGNMIDGPLAGRDGQFFLALNIAAFEDVATFKTRMDQIIHDYQATRLAPGFERVYVPGGLEVELARARRVEGVPLNDETIAGLAGSARALGVDGSMFETT